MQNNLTKGSIAGNLIRFSLPFFLSYLLQTLYGLADLFIIGLYEDAAATSAVSIGSQIMHMFTVIIVGLLAGSSVIIGHTVGAGDFKQYSKAVGNSFTLFTALSFILCLVLCLCINPIIKILAVPADAVNLCRQYLLICFLGIPFITLYNTVSAIFRGSGDSKTPMIFIAVSCVINILVDYIFIGKLKLSAAGAAWGTVISQTVSVLLSLAFIKKRGLGTKITAPDFIPDWSMAKKIFSVGFPVAVQDGFIQISFLVITIIANSRGVKISAAVGLVEKIIGIMFLIPSSMLSCVSTMCAQNAGAGLHNRSKKTLLYGILICVAAGSIFSIIIQFYPEFIVRRFSKDTEVIKFGGQYLKSYVFDCIFAGIHFCFSGFFTAYKKSIYSFIHNIISVLLARIPLAYLATVFYPDSLYPMGFAAPIGSLLSSVICIIFYTAFFNRKNLSAIHC